MPSVHAVSAPVEGTVVQINRSNGSAVKKGDILIRTEAGKTSTQITSPADGTLRVLAQQGANVKQGDKLAEVTN
ncbi:hypothetical protein M422DRAFT_23987 [Sphaerobolus stellatus SS14]|nr:hypothetical protein M422DRAFT_23987 [Sphaerobolus stellatus SS14]